MNNSIGSQYQGEYNSFEAEQFEYPLEQEFYQEIGWESPFGEAEEMELAAQLLEITDEAELDQFIGNLVKKAWRGVSKVAKGVIRPLGGVLKTVAKTALPFVGGALGSFIPIPGVGTALGTALGGALSKALEMEFEGLDPEDQEFEMARRFVRLAGTTARQAALTPTGVDPSIAVRDALLATARQQIPDYSRSKMLPASYRGDRHPLGQRGRWIRCGRKIILLGE